MVEANKSAEWAVTALNRAETVDEIRLVLKSSARASVQAQGATVVELDGDQCFYADEDAMSPLWKGQRFPVSFCISGWAITVGQTVAIPDIFADSRVPHDAYRPTFVRSLVMVPITVEEPVAAVGVYWGYPHQATDAEVAVLERLALAAGQALARVGSAGAGTPPAGSSARATGGPRMPAPVGATTDPLPSRDGRGS